GGSETVQPALRLGFRLVKGFSKTAAAALIAARQERPFRSSADLKRRAGLQSNQLECLIAAGALQGLSGHRHQAHWEAAGIEPPLESALFLQTAGSLPAADPDPGDGVSLSAPTELQDLNADYNTTGLTLRRHPMLMLR